MLSWAMLLCTTWSYAIINTCRFMLCCFMPLVWCIVLCYAVLYCAMLCYMYVVLYCACAMLCYVVLHVCCSMLCYIIVCYAVLCRWCAMLCNALIIMLCNRPTVLRYGTRMLWYAMLCWYNAMLCCAMLCCAVMCHAMSCWGNGYLSPTPPPWTHAHTPGLIHRTITNLLHC